MVLGPEPIILWQYLGSLACLKFIWTGIACALGDHINDLVITWTCINFCSGWTPGLLRSTILCSPAFITYAVRAASLVAAVSGNLERELIYGIH